MSARDQIVAEYREAKEIYQALAVTIAEQVEAECKDRGINCVNVEKRAKDETSLRDKITRKKYTSLLECTDLAGVRVVCTYQDEIERIGAVLGDLFDIDQNNSIDKTEPIGTDRFGYKSSHFVISLRSDQLKEARYKRFTNKKAEVQVRTVLQHAWSVVDHKLNYKRRFEREELKRRLSILSALFELADHEMVRLRELADELQAQDEKKREKNDPEAGISQATISDFFEKNQEFLTEIKRKAQENALIVRNQPIESHEFGSQAADLAAFLQSVDIETIGQLQRAMENFSDDSVELMTSFFTEQKVDTAGSTFYPFDLLYFLITTQFEQSAARATVPFPKKWWEKWIHFLEKSSNPSM